MLARISAPARLLFLIVLSARFGRSVAGNWTLLFRQTHNFREDFLYTDYNDLLSYGSSEADPNYSILNQLENFRDGDGKFLFKYEDGYRAQIWKQSYNPLAPGSEYSDVTQGELAPGYEAVAVSSIGCYWGGLLVSNGPYQAWLDGSSGSSWWFAIGSRTDFSDGHIPGICGQTTHQVELYVYAYDGRCEAGEYADDAARACQRCPENTFSTGPVVTASSCTPCPAGEISLEGASSCWLAQPGWNLVFRQSFDNVVHVDLPFGSYNRVLSFGDEDDPNFSRLGLLERLKGGDGKLTLQFFDGVNKQIWRQSTNFVLGEYGPDGTTSGGYEPIFISSVGCHWAGLVPSSCNWLDGEPRACGSQAWFDGTEGHNFWFAIGLTHNWMDAIPGVCGHTASVVELYAHYFTGFCQPGEHVSPTGAWCVPCPVNTFSNETRVTATSCRSCPEFTYAWPGSSECVSVEDTGGWVTIFKQTGTENPSAFLLRPNALLYGDSEDDPNFSRLQDLEDFRNNDGKFTFRFFDGTNTQIWRQSLNFVTTGSPDPSVPAAGYEPISIASEGCNWGGLQPSGTSGGGGAWFDGSQGGSWWWAIAARSGSSMPGSCQHWVEQVQLEVYRFPGFCGVGERVDPLGAWCIPCARNTFSNNSRMTDINCPACPAGAYSVEGQTECVEIAISTGWHLVFRQSYDPNDARDDNDELVFIPYENVLFYGTNTDDPNYSRLAHLDDFRDPFDGKLFLKYTDGTHEQTWKQSSNFVTTDVLTTPVQGLENLDVPDENCYWGGLQQSTGSHAWFDGSTGGWWWWAVGSKISYGSGQIPGLCSIVTNQVELWAYIFPGYCSAGEHVVAYGGRCAPCPRNTYSDDERVTATECTPCDAGTFSPQGASECSDFGISAGWNTVFRHTHNSVDDFVFTSLDQTLWLNPDSPSSPNYSILQLLEGAFFQYGRFRFRYLSDGGREVVWRQTSNPTTTTDSVSGYRAETRPANPDSSGDCYWHGLALGHHPNSQSYMDGSRGGWWWFAVGARSDYGGGYIPGACSYNAHVVELQAYLFDGTCGAGEYVHDDSYCAPCPVNSFTTGTAHSLTECTACPLGLVAPAGSSVCLDLVIPNGWTLLFRQTVAPQQFWFENYEDALWLNANDTSTDNYSILGALELLRERGRFKFKYVNVYPGDEERNKETIWTQTSNFVDDAEGDTPSDLVSLGSPPTWSYWQGLTRAEGGARTWWDGTDGSGWWWALAAKGPFYSPEGIPGVFPYTAPRVELWAYREHAPVFCEPGEVLDLEGECLPCPQNTFSSGGTLTECEPCPPAQFASPGSSSCISGCPGGHRWDRDTAACVVCPANTYADGSTAACEPCPPGDYSAAASTECRTPIPCDENAAALCHTQAWCDDGNCTCYVGFIGNGEGEDGCSGNGFSVRVSIKYLTNPGLQMPDGTLAFWDSVLRDQFTALLGLSSGAPPNFKSSMHHEVQTVEVDPTMPPVGLITINALFAEQSDAETAANSLRTNLNLDGDGLADPPKFSGIPLSPSNVLGPNVYAWTAGTTSDAVAVEATGMTVEAISFSPSCEETGCWVFDVLFTLGRDSFNVLYIPHAVGDDTLSTDWDYTDASNQDWSAPRYNYNKPVSSTFEAANFPCGSNDYVPDGSDYPPLKITSCCLPEFIDMYRPLQGFYDDVWAWGIEQSDCELTTTEIPVFDRPRWAGDDIHPRLLPLPTNYVHGAFKGMSHCSVEFRSIVDPYIRQYRASIICDERELRNKAGMLTGTVGVEHAVDTFVGIGNFKPTGVAFLDSAAMQVNIHLEKTSFFTVSTHGENDYTFLEYVNLRLVAVYDEDTDLSEDPTTGNSPTTTRTDSADAAHYLQVTFTLGSQYVPNENSGLIPMDSVRVGAGEFLSTTDMSYHPCAQYTALPGYDAFPGKSVFDARFPDPDAEPASQMCAPNAQMCASPASTPDHFVAFNVPLGIDWLPSPASGVPGDMETLSRNVFVHMVISAKDKDQIGVSTPNDGEDPHQMKTTLSASIPVVDGGINTFCDQITAKTDLQDVVNADLLFGTASDDIELSRLRIFEDIASSVLDRTAAPVFETDSIESGFMTLVIKGDESYFGLGGTRGYGIQLEDLITVHIMETGDAKYNFVKAKLEEAGDDNYADASNLNVGGYNLNGAFRFEIDRSENRARLHPRDELLAECPFTPSRPDSTVLFPATCIVRRDVNVQLEPSPIQSAILLLALARTLTQWRQGREYPTRLGADAATAQEVLAAEVLDRSSNGVFVQSVLGQNDFALQLGQDFSRTIAITYGLNDRFRRAWFVNPGYEWTPTQTGGQPIFTVSQRIFMFALINLDENLVLRRAMPSRRLLQTVSGSGAGVAGSELSFATSPTSLMANSFGVPEDNVATFAVEAQLTAEEACLDSDALQRRLTATFVEYLAGATSALETAQLLSVTVRDKPSSCERRILGRSLRATLSDAVAAVEMVLVFADSEVPMFNVAHFAEMPGINSIQAQSVSSSILLVEGADSIPGQDAAPPDDSAGSGPLIAGICGGVGGALLVCIGVFAWMRRRAHSEDVQTVAAVRVLDKDRLMEEARSQDGGAHSIPGSSKARGSVTSTTELLAAPFNPPCSSGSAAGAAVEVEGMAPAPRRSDGQLGSAPIQQTCEAVDARRVSAEEAAHTGDGALRRESSRSLVSQDGVSASAHMMYAPRSPLSQAAATGYRAVASARRLSNESRSSATPGDAQLPPSVSANRNAVAADGTVDRKLSYMSQDSARVGGGSPLAPPRAAPDVRRGSQESVADSVISAISAVFGVRQEDVDA